MIEKFQFLQSFFLYTGLIASIFVGISGFGWNFYTRKINNIKSLEQKKTNETNNANIIDNIDNGTKKVIKTVKSIPKISKSEIKQEVNINSNNAQIITNNQSGGSNTVINNNLDIPLPTILIKEWSVQNIKKETISSPFAFKVDTIKQRYGYDFLYFNKIEFSYNSKFSYNQIGLRIKRKDIIIGSLFKVGKIQYGSGNNKEGDFMFIIAQPEVGIYVIDLYSVKELINPIEEFDYLK